MRARPKQPPRHQTDPTVSEAARKARAMIFFNRNATEIEQATGLTSLQAAAERLTLESAGAGPASKGPYTAAQVAVISGLTANRIRQLATAGVLATEDGPIPLKLFSRAAVSRFLRKARPEGRRPAKTKRRKPA